MKSSIALVLLLFLTGYSIAEENKLFHDTVNIPSKTGKPLKMELKEIQRKEHFSLIEVEHSSGASVPSIMFVVKGMYEIAKSRDCHYFINLKEWSKGKGHWMYKVGFTKTNDVDPKKFFGKDIDPKKELTFLSVKDYDQLWGDQNNKQDTEQPSTKPASKARPQ